MTTMSPTMRKRLKSILPSPALNAWRHTRYWIQRRRNQSPEEVFTAIYKRNTWGGDKGTFFSGGGTRDPEVSEPYVQGMRTWLQSLGSTEMTIVDLGCGDFAVGQRFIDLCASYVGVDVVADLIKHNRETYGSEKVSFRHLDISRDALPDGDVCIIRQVLQHLSNDQIAAILPKLHKYPYVVVSEHHPFDDIYTRPNVDKPANDGTRIVFGSGVFLGEPPFDGVNATLAVLPELPLESGILRTYLITSKQAESAVA